MLYGSTITVVLP